MMMSRNSWRLRAVLTACVFLAATMAWAGQDQESNCSDLIDNDGDGFVDCSDTDCTSPPGDPACCAAGATEVSFLCVNGIDDDCNGVIDCWEPDCVGFLYEVPFSPNTLGCVGLGQRISLTETAYPGTPCADGLDNEGNGRADCADLYCINAAGECTSGPEAHCADDYDNDNDGDTDCTDLDCEAFCTTIPTLSQWGLVAFGMFLLTAMALALRRQRTA